MQTKDILVLENAEAGAIILHKEGLFWRAYQYSAFLFAIHIRPLKVNTKFVKVVNTEIAYLGFPEKVLEAVLQQAAVADCFCHASLMGWPRFGDGQDETTTNGGSKCSTPSDISRSLSWSSFHPSHPG